MSYLNQNKAIDITYNQLLEGIGLTTKIYRENSYYHESFNMSKGLVNCVINKTNDVLRGAAKASLMRLEKEGYITVGKPRIAIVYSDNSYQQLSSNESDIVRELEVETLEGLNISKKNDLLYNKKIRDEFNSIMNEKILCNFQCGNIQYYFNEYKVTVVNEDYKNKSTNDIYDLTRKFVKVICLYMLNIKYENYIYSMERHMVNTIKLMNMFFTVMDDDNWNRYTDELNDEDIFFQSYYMTYYNLMLSEKKYGDKLSIFNGKNIETHKVKNTEIFKVKELDRDIEEFLENLNLQGYKQDDILEMEEVASDIEIEDVEFKEDFRGQAIEGLGIEIVKEIESVVPNMDWDRIFKEDDGEYSKYCVKIYGKYKDIVEEVQDVKDDVEKNRIIEVVMKECIAEANENTWWMQL